MIPYKPQTFSDEAIQVNVTQEQPVLEGVKMLAQLTLSVLVFLWMTQLAFEDGAPWIPQSWESQLATLYCSPSDRENNTASVGFALNQPLVLSKSKEQQRLEAVFYRVLRGASTSGSPQHLTFSIQYSNQPTVNAISLPGGQMVVYRGLLEALANDDELALVLGHELAHYAHRDHLKMMGRRLVFALALQALGQGNEAISSMASSLGNMSDLQFSQQQELEADKDGLRWMQAAGYNPKRGLRFFKTLETEPSSQLSAFLSTHPKANQREAALKKWLEEKSPKGAV